MSEDIVFSRNASREENYRELMPQIEALFEGEDDVVANSANMVAALKEVFDFFWVGFYFVKGDELVLAPFQGPVACTRIGYGKGVCGTAWKEQRVQLVPDVNAFPGHIACSALSKSEIVVPVFKDGEVVAVLDVDSDRYNDFDEVDEYWLTKMVGLLNF